MRWVRSHALRRKTVGEMTAEDVGNHVCDRIAANQEKAASREAGAVDAARKQRITDRRLSWRVAVDEKEITGKVRKGVTWALQLRMLREYFARRDEEEGLPPAESGVDTDVMMRMVTGGRRQTWSVAEMKIVFGLWNTKARDAKHKGMHELDDGYDEAVACPVCGKGLDTQEHVVGECTHEDMVRCRRKWIGEVKKTMQKYTSRWRARGNLAAAAHVASEAMILSDAGQVRDLCDIETLVEILGPLAAHEQEGVDEQTGAGQQGANLFTWLSLLVDLSGLGRADAAGMPGCKGERRKRKKLVRLNLDERWREVVTTAFGVRDSQAVEMLSQTAKRIMGAQQALWRTRGEILHKGEQKRGAREQVEVEVEEALTRLERVTKMPGWMEWDGGAGGVEGMRERVQRFSIREKRHWLKRVNRTTTKSEQPKIKDFFKKEQLDDELRASRAATRQRAFDQELKTPAKPTTQTLLEGTRGGKHQAARRARETKRRKMGHDAEEGSAPVGSKRTRDGDPTPRSATTREDTGDKNGGRQRGPGDAATALDQWLGTNRESDRRRQEELTAWLTKEERRTKARERKDQEAARAKEREEVTRTVAASLAAKRVTAQRQRAERRRRRRQQVAAMAGDGEKFESERQKCRRWLETDPVEGQSDGRRTKIRQVTEDGEMTVTEINKLDWEIDLGVV